VTLSELLDLLLRWVHLIAGIMWIGNSMLFNWLDRNLVKREGSEHRPGYAGEIWLVHSGYFYQMEKKLLAPGELPAQLHWFKWQNGVTWLSGIALLFVVYYMNDAAFLVNPARPAVSSLVAIGLSIGAVLAAWAAYETIWTALQARPRLASALSLALLGAAAFALAQAFSGRAAYIHVGVILGSVMTGNVWTVIMPSQRELIAATKAGRDQDPTLAARAKQRSIHNNYMTFPLLFIMVSNHFPSTYGHTLNWLILAILMVGSAAVRHFMNIRFVTRRWLEPLLLVAAVTIAAVVALTWPRAPAAREGGAAEVTFAEVREIVDRRCRSCHSVAPTDAVFAVPPSGVLLDTPAQIQSMAVRIQNRAVITKTMPFANKTAMTDEERAALGRWYESGARGP
jgi:uncharacterized membrane protein